MWNRGSEQHHSFCKSFLYLSYFNTLSYSIHPVFLFQILLHSRRSLSTNLVLFRSLGTSFYCFLFIFLLLFERMRNHHAFLFRFNLLFVREFSYPPNCCCICCAAAICAACASLAFCKTTPTICCPSKYFETHRSVHVISPKLRSGSLCLRFTHFSKQVEAILLKRSVYISISVLAVWRFERNTKD